MQEFHLYFRAPRLRELATSINDVLAITTRLTPHLRAVQRWLVENGDLEDVSWN